MEPTEIAKDPNSLPIKIYTRNNIDIVRTLSTGGALDVATSLKEKLAG
ncbi:MAG: hypothetical protein HYY67_03805 [Thaumarchaeota archaeon]|nr:hypothetical protein [Nitrososphaerota archaeon]